MRRFFDASPMSGSPSDIDNKSCIPITSIADNGDDEFPIDMLTNDQIINHFVQGKKK